MLNILIPYFKLSYLKILLFEPVTHLVFGFHRGKICVSDLNTI